MLLKSTLGRSMMAKRWLPWLIALNCLWLWACPSSQLLKLFDLIWRTVLFRTVVLSYTLSRSKLMLLSGMVCLLMSTILLLVVWWVLWYPWCYDRSYFHSSRRTHRCASAANPSPSGISYCDSVCRRLGSSKFTCLIIAHSIYRNHPMVLVLLGLISPLLTYVLGILPAFPFSSCFSLHLFFQYFLPIVIAFGTADTWYRPIQLIHVHLIGLLRNSSNIYLLWVFGLNMTHFMHDCSTVLILSLCPRHCLIY